MKCHCCTKGDSNEEAESSSAAALGGSSAPSAPHGSRIDRGFDDDKAAIKKWREQHSPSSTSSPPGDTNSNNNLDKNRMSRVQLPEQQYEHHSHRSSDSNSAGNQLGYDENETETNQPAMMSPRAVQAWQQQPSKQQNDVSFPKNRSLSQHQPTGTAVSQQASKISQIGSISLNLDHEQQQTKVLAENKASPSIQQHNIEREAQPSQAQPMQYQDSSNNNHQHSNKENGIRGSHNKNRRRSKKTSHPHEGLRDQLIRETVLQQEKRQQQQLSTNSRSFSIDEVGTSSSGNSSNDSNDEIKGQVFLQVHPRDIISPHSSLDDDNDYDTSSSSLYQDEASSQILSDAMIHSMGDDSETRERYILACRLLRARMMQQNDDSSNHQGRERQPPILPMERDLLEDLLARFKASSAGGSQVAFEALSKLLADNDEIHGKHNPGAVVTSTSTNKIINNARVSFSGSHSSSSAHNSSSNLNDSRDGEYTVASIREDEGGGFDTILKPRRSSSWKDEKSPKATPLLMEKKASMAMGQQEQAHKNIMSNHSKLPVEEPTSSKIRLDGWQKEDVPFKILGLDQDTPASSRVLTPGLMEALRGFFPYSVSEDNFWLKFSMARDGASLRSLLHKVMASKHTIICIETKAGDVFGSFTSSQWQTRHDQKAWFGTGEAFLWRLKQCRYVNAISGNDTAASNEMEVYPFTGHDDMVQYCTSSTIAVGGGNWNDAACPYKREPTGIGLMVDGDLEGGETNSCATFANPRLCGRATSANEFTISNLEVWTLTPSTTVAEAEQLERQKYFIQEQTARPGGIPASPSRLNQSMARVHPRMSPM